MVLQCIYTDSSRVHRECMDFNINTNYTSAWFFVTNPITKEALVCLEEYPNIIRWSSMILWLGDDLGTSSILWKPHYPNAMFESLKWEERRGEGNGYPFLLFGCFKKLRRGRETYIFPLCLDVVGEGRGENGHINDNYGPHLLILKK